MQRRTGSVPVGARPWDKNTSGLCSGSDADPWGGGHSHGQLPAPAEVSMAGVLRPRDLGEDNQMHPVPENYKYFGKF